MKKQTVKAWAILDKESGAIGRYDSDGEYMISAERTKQKHLHQTFKSIPCTITYTLPN